MRLMTDRVSERTFYFKGCPFRCKWAAIRKGSLPTRFLSFNSPSVTIAKSASKPAGPCALERQRQADINIHRSKCDLCGDCVSACPTEALQIVGRSYTVPDLLQILDKDRVIHRRSGGG